MSGWQARLQLGFTADPNRDGATVLSHRRHEGPLRVQKALYPEGPKVCHAVLLHPPAGVVGGDTLEFDIDVGCGAHALITTPGAGKWYRSCGDWATQSVSIRVADAAVCEWLPQDNLVFNGALARWCTEIEVAPTGCLIAWDMVGLGRTACGETFEQGHVSAVWRIRHGERLIWSERAQFKGGDALLTSLAGLQSHPVHGSLYFVSPLFKQSQTDESSNLAQDLRNTLRELLMHHPGAAVTQLDGLMVVRGMVQQLAVLKSAFIQSWHELRLPLTGASPVSPRIWST